MSKPGRMLDEIKWNTRQRMQYIEIMAFYTGAVSRSDVARAFGISDAAATKDLKLYGDLLPDNLIYRQAVFGFIPTNNFTPAFADLTPAKVLPVIAANLAAIGGPYGDQPVYGITTETLPLPTRLPSREVLASIIRAIRFRRKLKVKYLSMSDREKPETRVIEPHALANNGLRWHVRAYNNETFDFRDFVISRFKHTELLEEEAESDRDFDDDWTETVTLKLTPHPGLNEEQRRILLTDYTADDDQIEITLRRALIGYTLQRLSVDTTRDHSLNPNAYQLIVHNREEIEPFASWAFL